MQSGGAAQRIRVAAIQHDIAWNDRAANFTHVTPMIASAAAAGAQLVLLPETFSTGYIIDGTLEGEPVDGPSSTFLAEQARAHGIWVGGSCPELVTDRPANTFVLAGPDGQMHRYRKIHPWTRDGEDKIFESGTELVTVDIGGLRCTPFVCYDLRFADEFWQRAHATDAYLVVANWPVQRRTHWRTLLRARAIENQAYVVGVNRVGTADGNSYPGDSCVIDPMGELVATGAMNETIVLAELSAQRVADVRADYPFLNDRR